MKTDTLENLRTQLAEFAERRDWNQFHSPKNLSMALIAEVGELIEHFQWLTEDQSQSLASDKKDLVAMELADILIYLIRIADKCEIDLVDAAQQKIAINESRYPIQKVHGKAGRASDFKD